MCNYDATEECESAWGEGEGGVGQGLMSLQKSPLLRFDS